MLNSALYTELNRVFKTEVHIASEGEEGSFTCPSSTQRRLGRKQKKFIQIDDWGEAYHLNCPGCKDTRKRLYVCHMYGQKFLKPGTKQEYFAGRAYICHNEQCDVTAWLDQLDNSVVCTYIESKPRGFVRIIDKEMDIPKGCIPLIDPGVPSEVLSYLQERHFDPFFLHQEHMVMYMPEGTTYMSGEEKHASTEDRILIPIVQRIRAVGWQARIIGNGKYPDSSKKKYIFPGRSKKNQWLYNMDTALYQTDITIVEGVTDVWRVGAGGLAIFGKKPSAHQYQIISYLWKVAGSCVICLDKDAQKQAKKIHEVLLASGGFPDGVTNLELEHGDPADYSPRELQELIKDARNEAQTKRA
jgi:hypothetical protein